MCRLFLAFGIGSSILVQSSSISFKRNNTLLQHYLNHIRYVINGGGEIEASWTKTTEVTQNDNTSTFLWSGDKQAIIFKTYNSSTCSNFHGQERSRVQCSCNYFCHLFGKELTFFTILMPFKRLIRLASSGFIHLPIQ